LTRILTHDYYGRGSESSESAGPSPVTVSPSESRCQVTVTHRDRLRDWPGPGGTAASYHHDVTVLIPKNTTNLKCFLTSGTLPTFDIEGRISGSESFDITSLRYRYITISKVQPSSSISKVTKRPSISGTTVRYDNSTSNVLTFDIECLKSDKRRYRLL
jgi:hypothetical protein